MGTGIPAGNGFPAGLPSLDGRQREVLYLPARGHVVVAGTAGSGKTLMAIYRAAYLADDRQADSGFTLLLTFNRCLTSYIASVARGLSRRVAVQTYHQFATRLLRRHGYDLDHKILESPETLCCEAAKDLATRAPSRSILNRRSPRFIADEIRWIQQHGISSADEYRDAERIGQGTRVRRVDRDDIFRVYEHYLDLRRKRGFRFDWNDLPGEVLRLLGRDDVRRVYRHIVVDEGQDFSPVMLRSLVRYLPEDGSLTFFGDMTQQIYGNRISWRSAGLRVRKVWRFTANYRNTREIVQLARALADSPYLRDYPDILPPELPPRTGPVPSLWICRGTAQEREQLRRLGLELSRQGTVAILVRDHERARTLWNLLGQGAIELSRNLSPWPLDRRLFFGTYHSAKGLEFDAVILPFLSKENVPRPQDRQAYDLEDALSQEARLLYVAMTRARTHLHFLSTGDPTEILQLGDLLERRTCA